MRVEFLREWEDADLAGWDGDGWYFWDENYAYCEGPYPNAREAEEAAEEYFDSIGILK